MTILLAALMLISSGGASAQPGDLAGDWQGTIAGVDRRVVVLITGNRQRGWKGTLFSIDQSSHGVPFDEVTFRKGKVDMKVKAVMGRYQGSLNADATLLSGTWTSSGHSRSLELHKMSPDLLWVRCIEPERTDCHRRPGDDGRTVH